MAKIEVATSTAHGKKTKKRKSDEPRTVVETNSPSSKFKKLDLSQIGAKKLEQRQGRRSQHHHNEATTSATNTPVDKSTATTTTTTTTMTKRKATATTTDKSKKVKKPKKSTEEADAADSGDDNPIVDPSAVELQQADRAENQPDIETTRRKKRAKHQKVVATAKVDSVQRDRLRNLEYLRLWKSNRTAWKFVKLRQISVQNHLFCDDGDEANRIDDEMWALSLEYMSGTVGAGRQKTIEKAEQVIRRIDEKIESAAGADENDLVRSQDYTRARELLQLLQ